MITQAPIPSSFRDFLTVIFKRKYLIAIFFIGTVCTIVGITFSMEPTYKATGQILVKIGSRNVYSLSDSTGERISNTSRINLINTEKEFLKSRFLAEKVLIHLGPENIYPEKNINDESRWFNKGIFQHSAMKSIKKWFPQDSTDESIGNEISQQSDLDKKVLKFQKNLSIRDITNTSIIEIGFKHSDPEMCATIVNNYMDIYFDERLLFHRSAQSRTFFKDQTLVLKNRLDEAEKKLEQYKNENNITDLDQQQKLLLQQISNLRVNLNSTLSQQNETESRVALVAKQLSQTPKTVPQEEQTDHNEVLISRLEAMLVDLQIEEKELLSTYTPQSRKVTNVRERISIVENKIKEQETKLIQRSRVGVNITYQQLKEELFKNQANLEAFGVKKEMLTGQLADFQSEKETLNRMETELNGLQQSVDLYRGNYKLYLAKMESARIEDAMDNENINEVISMDRALTPLKPISPKYRLNIILSILIGGMGGILIAIIGDFMDDNLETPEDVERALQLTVLTSIPDTASRKRLDRRKEKTLPSDLRIQIP